MPQTPFQVVADLLDLKGALRHGTERNDLLPPRPEDGVSGEVGNPFVEALKRDFERGNYDPAPAHFVSVPKSPFATRPAALLNLKDRVVYEALVETLRSRLEVALLGNDILFWPRGQITDKRWREFEAAPLLAGFEYVVIADVSAFYESIDHELLADRLTKMTGRRAESEAIREFLDRVMQSARGIPQGLGPSDSLATGYISQIDFAMVRDGYHYCRHGDDIRIAALTYDDARRGLMALESRIREAGLQLNAYKSKVLKRSTYEAEIQSIDKTVSETKRKLLQGRLEELSQDSDALQEAIKATDKEELGWSFFYHGTLSLDEVIEELRPHLVPDDIHVAEQLFNETVDAAPGTPNALGSDAFHQRLSASLVRLAASRSTSALPKIGNLLRSYPDKTELFCSYLSALVEKTPKAVTAQLEIALPADTYRTEWEAAWIAKTLLDVHEHVSEATLSILMHAIKNPHNVWLFAIGAARVLAARGELQREDLSRMWNTCPHVLRVDLVLAAGAMANTHAWAKAFFEAAQDEPINVVAAKQLLRLNRSTGPSGPTGG